MPSLRSVLQVIGDVRTAVAAQMPLPVRQGAMYAQLGTIVFEVVGPITGLTSKREYRYAAHEVVQGKPRLEAIGDGLEVLSLTLEFLREITDPVTAFADLCAAAAAYEALPLVFADGQVMGHYVVTAIDDVIDRTDDRGTVTHRRTRVELTEWDERPPTEVASRARRASASQQLAQAPKVAFRPPTVYADPAAVPLSVVTRRP